MKNKFLSLSKSEEGRFVAVGIVNTLIDFIILNIFAHMIGLPRVPSNVISASFAMAFSFYANKKLVFRSEEKKHGKQLLLFILVTVTSVYVVQNLIITLMSEWWPQPLDTAHSLVDFIDKELFVTNASKLAATGFSMVWNFILYKKLVFKNDKK